MVASFASAPKISAGRRRAAVPPRGGLEGAAERPLRYGFARHYDAGHISISVAVASFREQAPERPTVVPSVRGNIIQKALMLGRRLPGAAWEDRGGRIVLLSPRKPHRIVAR